MIANNILPVIRKVIDRPLVVIDNFYENPDEVRQEAINSNYMPPIHGNFPGQTAFVSLETQSKIIPFVIALAENYMAEALDIKIPVDTESTECYYQIIDKPWHKAPQAFRVPHVDYRFQRGIVTIPALIYLNTPEQCLGGTAFYRDVRTGLHSVNSPAQFHKVYTGGQNTWQLHNYIPMKYNRLIMYDGNMMHTADIPADGFGEELENCRMTQNIFLHVKI
tara:strand:- start:2093 stop:2755 length:663 start_codon:yes stop_codon:yes gene_type:complete